MSHQFAIRRVSRYVLGLPPQPQVRVLSFQAKNLPVLGRPKLSYISHPGFPLGMSASIEVWPGAWQRHLLWGIHTAEAGGNWPWKLEAHFWTRAGWYAGRKAQLAWPKGSGSQKNVCWSSMAEIEWERTPDWDRLNYARWGWAVVRWDRFEEAEVTTILALRNKAFVGAWGARRESSSFPGVGLRVSCIPVKLKKSSITQPLRL